MTRPLTGPRTRPLRLGAVLAGALLLLSAGTAASVAEPGHRSGGPRNWVGTWAAVPTATPESATPVLKDDTVRQVVHTSVGGDRVRLRLNPAYDSGDLLHPDDAGMAAMADAVPTRLFRPGKGR